MGNGATGGNGSDFLVISLVNGLVRVSMNLEDGILVATKNIETQLTYNDTQIHDLELTRSPSGSLELVVDDERRFGRGKLFNCYKYLVGHLIFLSTLALTNATRLSTVPPLWIGGVPESFVPPHIGQDISFESFRGCISRFTFTDDQDILSSIISFTPALYNQ